MDEKAVRKLIKKGAKAKSDEIIEAIKGYNIETDQAKKLELARAHLDYLDDMITQTEVELYVRIKPYYEFVEFVSSMPGMTELSSTIILAEIGINMDIFDDVKHLCSWCGLSPANNESAGKKKSVRIAKAGAYLKPMMVQCALAAIKNKKEPYFAIKYGRIKKRRGHKKAIIAIARMMMVCIYHMVSEKKPFSPTDYEELMDPQNHVERVVLNENNVFAYLESLGYDSSQLVKRNDYSRFSTISMMPMPCLPPRRLSSLMMSATFIFLPLTDVGTPFSNVIVTYSPSSGACSGVTLNTSRWS